MSSFSTPSSIYLMDSNSTSFRKLLLRQRMLHCFFSLSMASGSLIKGPLQTSEHLIKLLEKLMRHNVYTSVGRLVKLQMLLGNDTNVKVYTEFLTIPPLKST